MFSYSSDVSGLDPKVVIEEVGRYLKDHQQARLKKIMLLSYGGSVTNLIENWLKAAIYASSMAVPKQKSFRKEIFQGVSNLIPGVRGE